MPNQNTLNKCSKLGLRGKLFRTISYWVVKQEKHNFHNVGPLPVIRWFINPMNTIVIGTINHSEIGVICTNWMLSNGGFRGIHPVASPSGPRGAFRTTGAVGPSTSQPRAASHGSWGSWSLGDGRAPGWNGQGGENIDLKHTLLSCLISGLTMVYGWYNYS